MQIARHIVFWLITQMLMTLAFGYTYHDYSKAFFFAAFLLPVAMATSYFFNYYLLPNYLLRRRFWLFGLYFMYSLTVSLYLQMLVITLSFIVLANYNYREFNPMMANVFILTIAIYGVVFLNSGYFLLRQLFSKEFLVKKLEAEKKLLDQKYIQIRANRKNYQLALENILYLESLSDYVQIHTKDQTLMTKERISTFEKKVPTYFIRIHRSYIVNTQRMDHYNKEMIEIGGNQLPISRKYKAKVIEYLQKPWGVNLA